MKYIFVIITIILVTYGQIIIKYEVNKLGKFPINNISLLFKFFIKAIANWGIISGLLAAIIAAFLWIFAMSKFELSSIYPLLSINFILVPMLAVFLFNEEINFLKTAGIIIITIGIIVFSKGV